MARYKKLRAMIKAGQQRRVHRLSDLYAYGSMDTARTSMTFGLYPDGSGYVRITRDGAQLHDVCLSKEPGAPAVDVSDDALTTTHEDK